MLQEHDCVYNVSTVLMVVSMFGLVEVVLKHPIKSVKNKGRKRSLRD